MRYRDILRFSFENILRGGRKALLSILAIAVGIFSVCLISGAGTLASAEIEARIAETGLGGLTIFPSKNGEAFISAQQIKTLPYMVDGVRAVTPFSMETATLIHRGKQRSVAMIGVNEDIDQVFDLRLLYGRMLTSSDISAQKPVIVIDVKLARILYERENITGKKLQLHIDGRRVYGEVIGVIESQKESLEGMMGISLPHLIYTPYTVLESITGTPHTEQIAIDCFADFDEDRVAEDAARYLTLSNHVNYKVENLNKYISSLTEIVDILRLFIEIVASIALLVGGLGIMNCMLYTVDARRSEIGICKALGEPRISILLRFLTEAVTLCMIGSIVGIGTTHLTTALLYDLTGLKLNISVGVTLQSAGLAFICGILSGFFPALRASNLDPIDVIIR